MREILARDKGSFCCGQFWMVMVVDDDDDGGGFGGCGGGPDVILREDSGEVRGKEESGEFTMELSNELLLQPPRVSNVVL